ncbi:Os08g0465000 [Oryza sativa Japonica Group]|uniref:Os08g0465000 protein n=1 Tax=Oryza sativa subsp. japonica TaxID=39947 RepID=A0A0P0XHH1_ORYSJ|nr:hypothetical protein EE612_044765 [Oryza sativa]BAT05792.1 Os08g0465000 [Oryza sativa Japonica Group]
MELGLSLGDAVTVADGGRLELVLGPATASTSAPAAATSPAAAPTAAARTAVASPEPHRPSSFAALFAAPLGFPLTAAQPRPPPPASNCL